MVNCPHRHHVTMCDGVKLYGITNNVGEYTGSTSFEEFPCPFLYVFVHTCSCTMDLHCLTFAVYKMGCFAAFLKFLPAFKLVFFLILQRKILQEPQAHKKCNFDTPWLLFTKKITLNKGFHCLTHYKIGICLHGLSCDPSEALELKRQHSLLL